MTLKETIKQTGPFSSAEQEVFLNLVRTSAVMEHFLAERLKAHGLTPTQYNVLRILRGAGADGLCRADIGDRMIKPVPDVTRLLDRLIEAGLVVRERDDEDRRYISARVTEDGLDLLARLDELVIDVHATQFGHMSRAELRQLVELLSRAREGAETPGRTPAGSLRQS